MFMAFCNQCLVICFTVHILHNKCRTIHSIRLELRRNRHFAVVLCYAEIICITREVPTIDTHTDLIAVQSLAENRNRLAYADAHNHCRNRNFTASQRRYHAVFYRGNSFVRTSPFNLACVHIRRCNQRRRIVHFNPLFAACRKVYCEFNVNCRRCFCKLRIRNGEDVISRRPIGGFPRNKHLVEIVIGCLISRTQTANRIIIIYDNL